MKLILSYAFFSAFLPCVMAETPVYSDKHIEITKKLSIRQDELQADTSDLILGETNAEVVDLLKKCRNAMNDAVDMLDEHDTGGRTLAAQSDVIELIYQAAKAKNSGNGAKGQAIMDMLRQLLGMDSSSPEEGQEATAEGEGGGKEGEGQGKQGKGKGKGTSPGKGAQGSSDMASSQETGVSDPDMAAESRSVPKSTGISPDEMPVEFRKALDAYNKTLQK